MPLPWLIGAAVVGLGAALVNAVSSDSTPSSTGGGSNGAEEEQRRRQAAAEAQRKQEREQKQSNARTLFQEHGERIGESVSAALEGVVNVATLGTPDFDAKLSASGYQLAPTDTRSPDGLVRALCEAFPEDDKEVKKITDNLAFYARVYNVYLQGHTQLYAQLVDLLEVDLELQTLDKIEQQLRAVKSSADAAA